MDTACHDDIGEQTARGLKESLGLSIIGAVQDSSHLLLDGLLAWHAADGRLLLGWNCGRNSRVHCEPEKRPPEQVDDPDAPQRPTA